MQNKDNLSKMIHFLARLIGISIAVALTLFVAVTALGIYWPDIQAYRYKLEAERFKKEIDAEKIRIDNLRKADTFGGKTPEETFDMFLNALKKNDAELASKYYDVTVQDKAFENYKKELKEKGDLSMSLNYFTEVRGGDKKCNKELDGCVFEFFYETESENVVLDELGNKIAIPAKEKRNKFIDLNSVSSIWKINQPF